MSSAAVETARTKELESAVLTGGLRRVFLGVVSIACLLVVLQVMAVGRLQTQIVHWSRMAEVDGIQERVAASFNLSGELQTPNEPSAVLTAFDELALAIDRLKLSASDQDAYAELASLTALARGHYADARQKSLEIIQYRSQANSALERLRGIGGVWAAAVRNQETEALRRAERSDAELRRVSSRRAQLTDAMLAAQSLQQQIIASYRLFETSTPDVIRSSVRSLELGAIPAPCTEEDDDTLCSPSSRRLYAATENLRNATPDQVDFRIAQALMAIEGYIRSGRIRLSGLQIDETRALATATQARDQLSRARNLTASIGRISRLFRDADLSINQQFQTSQELLSANRRLTSYLSQLRVRMAGLVALSDDIAADPPDFETALDGLLVSWTGARALIQERIDLMSAFQAELDRLSSEVAAQEMLVRQETTLWVYVYSTVFFTLACIVVASILSLFWIARRRFVAPLSQVTSSILDLSRGRHDGRIVLSERAFGFDRLGAALERLRQEMSERHALAVKTKEQQRIIESNLAELERTNDEMQWLAMHDPLTGLGNRRRIDRDSAEWAGEAGADFCVMQLDIDRFKEINDSLGHAAGDHVLKTVSRILTETLDRNARCYRLGGDEFFVVITGEISETQASEIAETLVRKIDEPTEFEGHLCRVGASVGIAFGRGAGFNAATLLKNADLALYEAKKSGRGNFRFFTDDLASQSSRRKMVTDRLLVAIETLQFEPYYQPQYQAGSLAIRGAEVLCRWNDPELGWVSPAEFMPVAEELGVMGRIDEILFDKVADDLRHLRSEGVALPRISFNITSDRLLKTNLASELRRKIGQDVKIALELLESMSLDNPSDSIAWAIQELKENGIEIEIDDFGSYKASLAGLIAVHPDAMKIDRSIVIPIIESERHLNLVKRIIEIGAVLDIEVVAEGVESEAHVKTLTELGCSVFQGFGLARPVPFSELVPLCHAANERRRPSSAIA